VDSYKSNLFGPTDQAALLETMRVARRHVRRLCGAIPADSERYKRCEEVISAMDNLAADLTGDKEFFYAKS
jgi:hypothetical protein